MGRFLNLIQGNPSPQESKTPEVNSKESSPSSTPRNKKMGKKR
jgi:hypothetical protein